MEKLKYGFDFGIDTGHSVFGLGSSGLPIALCIVPKRKKQYWLIWRRETRKRYFNKDAQTTISKGTL